MSWKTALYDYVHHKNQMDMDYSVEPLLPFVTDTSFLQSQIKRLARTAHSDQDRHFFPVKNETRLSILRAAEQHGQVIAEVRLRRTSVGTIGTREHEEKRVETERVTLTETDGKWYIVRVEPTDAERALPIQQTVPGSLHEGEERDSLPYRTTPSPSTPFLNYNVLPYLETGGRKAVYNRIKAAEYADTWWDKANPDYIHFEVDCSNFISQCLFAGGAPMNYTGKRDSGWWYKGRYNGQEQWSYSWAVAHSLQRFLTAGRVGLCAEEVPEASMLDLGDVISYDWDGNGRFQHSTIVTAKDAGGMPLVNAHTTESFHRYWSYRDSVAWTEKTKYRFLHIADLM
ncbi:Putative amidase domain protein [Paenibacillus konkukensis]|uniref:Amidase domain protein n=1 Tax=Paenibacillus konkukensis TaxID=2020716 RepID=A0ABY4RRM2_9BACL|nr:amidase domain-containing protein [Paenibacillus konkukensis]UQZ84044.1 Putative amidase domain protein [Paenibacillus konkukensis]